MATLTIKIESDELAREVLAHMGYLPGDDIPDLVSVEDEEPVAEEEDSPFIETHGKDVAEDAFKAYMDKIIDRVDEIRMPKPTRRMPEEPKQNVFCTTDEPKPDVEPVDNELGAPLEVYSEETKKERDELYKQSREVHVPPPEERLKTQLEALMGSDILDYLDTMADHDDKAMREAVKAYVRKEYAGHNLRLWPALQKILDGNA